MLHVLSLRARKSLPLRNTESNTLLKPSVPSSEGADEVFLGRVMVLYLPAKQPPKNRATVRSFVDNTRMYVLFMERALL